MSAPGEADYPACLTPVTPQSYRAHLHATRALETTTEPDRKAKLEKALLSKEQQAALDLVDRLLTDDTVQRIKNQIGKRKPLVLPLLAVEAAGNNKIPLAMAEVLADRLGLDVELGIVQRQAEKHGPMMNEFWQETFGYDIDKLTQSEAGHLRAAPTIDAIRDRVATARHEGIERLGAARASAPARAMRGAAQAGVRATLGGNVGGGLQEMAQTFIGRNSNT